MKTKRVFSLIISLIITIALLSGCRDSSYAGSTTPAPPQDTGSVPTDDPVQSDATPEYPMNFTGYYTDSPEVISLAKSIFRDSKILLSNSQEGQQQIDEMERRIEEIVDAPTSIVKADTYVQGVSYCGTAYYVDAENGDDNNDGLSPETAFRTAMKLDFIEMKEGDAVFFRRGCVFYDACPTIQSGVTYSAYGEGAKPILTPSSNDANDPANWELYYENGGQKIWHYLKTDFSSVGWIDFNCSDDLYASPVYEYWSPETGYQYIETVYADYDEVADGSYSRNRYGELVTKEIHEMLTEDLTFVSRSDYEESNSNWCFGTNLYLRCDEGNPAEVFDVIKMTAMTRSEYRADMCSPVDSYESTNAVLDNLELSNGAQTGVSDMRHSTIQNCEVSFIGNTVASYDEWKPDESGYISVNYIGDGIYNCVDGVTVRNNYVHHCCCVGITGEMLGQSADPVLDEWVVDSNVVAYCGNSYGYQENDGWVNLEVEGFTVTDNYFAYSGECVGILRWYNDFNGIYIAGDGGSGTSDAWKFLPSKQHFIGNTVIGGYDSSLNGIVDGLNSIATFTDNTFVGDPMDNALMLIDTQNVIKYWQLCE